MTTPNYDTITDQFAPQLSPLARRIYAAIFEATSDPKHSTSVPIAHIGTVLGLEGPTWSNTVYFAIRDLMTAFLIEELPSLDCLCLTSSAWRAHLLAERAAKEARDVPNRS